MSGGDQSPPGRERGRGGGSCISPGGSEIYLQRQEDQNAQPDWGNLALGHSLLATPPCLRSPCSPERLVTCCDNLRIHLPPGPGRGTGNKPNQRTPSIWKPCCLAKTLEPTKWTMRETSLETVTHSHHQARSLKVGKVQTSWCVQQSQCEFINKKYLNIFQEKNLHYLEVVMMQSNYRYTDM